MMNIYNGGVARVGISLEKSQSRFSLYITNYNLYDQIIFWLPNQYAILININLAMDQAYLSCAPDL